MPIAAAFADLPAVEPGVILAWLGGSSKSAGKNRRIRRVGLGPP